MTLRIRLTLLFTLITASILLVFAWVIYFSAKENRESEFYLLLKKEGLTKANLFFNAKVETKTLQEIYLNNREILSEVEVAIYDTDFNLLYHDAVDIDIVKETKAMIDSINQQGEIKFYQGDWQVAGFKYKYQNKYYIIIVAAYDQYGFNKLNSLLRNNIIVFIVSILFIYIAGYFFSKKAFDPIKDMITKANQISATNLDLRLPAHRSNDELSALANTFNAMLNRLENSFDAQKQFVYHISHELRTPLTAIIAELELSVSKDRSKEDYKTAMQNVLHDAKKLVRLANSLLDLAKASYDASEITFKPIRIDELLLDAKLQVQQSNKDFKIDIAFEQVFENENQIMVNGNEYLLKVAFINLIENGCKFSPNKSAKVSISFQQAQENALPPSIMIKFIDEGIGISEDDLKNIFTPFYRGENKQFVAGSGIGLSLTQRIVLLHKGSISASSQIQKGTTFFVQIPHL